MKKYVVISGIMLFILSIFFILSGCGALITAIIQAVLGTKLGFIAIPAIAAAGLSDSQEGNLPGIIILPTNDPPPGYSTVEGATVTLEGAPQSVTTDGNGFFRFDEVPVGIKKLTVEYPGFITIQQDVVVSQEGTENQDFSGFKIVPDGPLTLSLFRGTIEVPQANFYFETYGIDPNGVVIRPQANWTVSPSNSNTTIDTQGNVTAFRTTAAGRYTITATSTINPSMSDTVEITVVEGTLVVQGTVTDQGGNPVAGATIRPGESNLMTETDENGYYILPAVPASSVITVTASTYNTHGSSTIPVDDPTQPVVINIMTHPSSPVPGRTPTPAAGKGNINGTTFQSDNITPIGNTFVVFYSLTSLSGSSLSGLASPDSYTNADPNGYYEIPNLPAGPCRLEFWENESYYNSQPNNPVGATNNEVQANTTTTINITAGSVIIPTPIPTPIPTSIPTPVPTTKPDLQSYLTSFSGVYPLGNSLYIYLEFNSSVTSLNLNDVEILLEDNPGFPFGAVSGGSVFDDNYWTTTYTSNEFRSSYSVPVDETNPLHVYVDFSSDQSAYFTTGKIIRLHFTSDGVNIGYLDVTL